MPVTRTLLAIGTHKGLFLATSEDRRSWSLDGPHFLMRDVYAVAIDCRREPARLLVGAASNHWGPSVSYSDDLGANWHEPDQAPVAFPPDTDASLARVWQLQPAGPDQPDVVWAGGEPGSLWRSTDGGVTYELVRALWDHPHRSQWEPGGGGQCLHTILAGPGERVVVAISTGGVYRSLDGGASWAPANHGIPMPGMPDPSPEFGQCVHKVAPDASDPNRLYLQNHGGVFRSDDAGTTWQSIAEGLPAEFGFPVVAHPHRADTAFVYPLEADVARIPPAGNSRVYRTSDAGKSWEARGDGLPSEHAYGTVLRDAMTADDADPVGLYLGTRNGEVWASVDEGGHWDLVAGHLPDVLVLRAATIG